MRRRGFLGSAAGAGMLLAVAGAVLAASMLDPFTQAELDNDWEADRQFPSGGVMSETAFGRTNVAQISIDSAETTAGTFTRTEGIKTVGVNNFGTSLEVDLYLDSAWATTAMRAGFWVVGDNGAGARDNFFGIVEFVHSEPCGPPACTSPATNLVAHEGFRFWDSATGTWTQVATPFSYGDWVTLGISLDATAGLYTYSVDGTVIGTAAGGTNFLREAFLNSYNFGLDDFPTLSSDSYSAHWHAGIPDPVTANDCKQGGYAAYGFANQGRCIQFVNTGRDSR